MKLNKKGCFLETVGIMMIVVATGSLICASIVGNSSQKETLRECVKKNGKGANQMCIDKVYK